MMAHLYPGFDIPAACENWRKRVDERSRQRRELWEKAKTQADIAVEGVTDPETWSRLETDALGVVTFDPAS